MKVFDWLDGSDPRPPRYERVRRLFLALFGLVQATAFASLAVQAPGLFGVDGILPVDETLERYREVYAGRAWATIPSVFWWLPTGDGALVGACWTGAALSLVGAIGLAPRYAFALAWGLYLSLVGVGGVFLGYQWDALLLETGLLAVLLAPGSVLAWRARRPASVLVVLLLRWLLFRLVFLSGAVKLLSDDPTWADGTALEYHYWTQPLPHALSHAVHHLPTWLHRVSWALMFFVELVVPFLVFGPRRVRRVAALAIAALFVAILLTGSYGFFEPLGLALCVPLLDDAFLGRCVPARWRGEPRDFEPVPRRFRAARISAFVLVLFFSAVPFVRRLGFGDALPRPVRAAAAVARPLSSFNAYGLFAVMTTERPEILVEGSRDGLAWTPYRFRYKPEALDERPAWAALHMPRLDWQMWFAALGDPRRNAWYFAFVQRLLEGSEPVLALLDGDPFEGEPPTYVRSMRYRYRFSTPAERAEGVWWTRESAGRYCPTLYLEDGELAALGR